MQAQKHGVRQDQPALPKILCDVIMSATSAWSSLLCTFSIGGTQRAKKKQLDTFNPSTKPR